MEPLEISTEYAPGMDFENLYVHVIDREQKKDKNGKPYVAMNVLGSFNRRSAKKFSCLPSDLEALLSADWLRISGKIEAGDYAGSVTIDNYQVVDQPNDPNLYLQPLKKDHLSHKRQFQDLMLSVQDQYLSKLLRKIFTREIWSQFCQAYAAQSVHHNYRGGLLEHSAEVAALCDSAVSVMSFLHRDLLVTCALIHDIGKLDEMDHGLCAGEYTIEGSLVGHIVSGAYRIQSAAESIDGFPATLKHAVVHLVLSHHGVPEFGAARVPACSEAFVLSSCDVLSARVFECRHAGDTAKQGQLSAKITGGARVYIGDLGAGPVVEKDMSGTASHNDFLLREPFPDYPVTLLVRGLVAAGDPAQSSDEPHEERDVTLPPEGADYLLRVTGDSMIGAGINGGDLLFVRKQETAKNGEIVIAHIPATGEVVKRLVQQPDPTAPNGGTAWLKSENPDPSYAPILVDEETRIQGKVTGMLRDY